MNIQKLFLATLLLILPIFCFGWGFPTRQKKDETIQPQQNVRSDEIPEEINESGPASPAQIQQTIDKIRKSPEDLKNEKEERKKEGSNPIIEFKTKKMKKLFHIFENPDYYHDQGVKIPRGILLVGPPGSGKTTYVKELATRGECWLYSQQAAAIGGSFAQEGVEYLKAFGDNPKNSLVFVAYQGEGSLGRRIQRGEREIMFAHGTKQETMTLKCRIETLEGFSGHSGRKQLMNFLYRCNPRPRKMIVNHGESSRCLDFASSVHKLYRIETSAPKNLESIRIR